MPHPRSRAVKGKLSKSHADTSTPTGHDTMCARSLLATKTRCKELAAKSAPGRVFVVRYAHTPSHHPREPKTIRTHHPVSNRRVQQRRVRIQVALTSHMQQRWQQKAQHRASRKTQHRA